MRESYRILPAHVFFFLLFIGLLGSQEARAQSNCTNPYLGVNGPEVCVTITPNPGGTPVVLRAPASMASPTFPVVGTYGEYDLNLMVTYAFSGTGMSVDATGTVTRSVAGTQAITIDVEGGWGAPMPGGGGTVSLSGFATGTALVQQGAAAGFPAGAGPAQDIVYNGFPPICYEPVYGPRPPGNVGTFDCNIQGLPVDEGAVAMRGITVVHINEVGDMVDLPAGAGVGEKVVKAPGNGSVANTVTRTCEPGMPGCRFSLWAQATGSPPPSFADGEIVGLRLSGLSCTGPNGMADSCTTYGNLDDPNIPAGAFINVGSGPEYSIFFDALCPEGPEEGVIYLNTNPGGQAAAIPVTCIAAGTPGSISGFKFEDLNGDGHRNILGFEDGEEKLEPGIANWPIYLNDVGQTGSPAAYTDENGNYVIAGLAPGHYEVSEASFEGWFASTQTEGIVIVVDGLDTPDIYFGNYRLGAISGYKWQDDDGDGVKDAGEPPLENWSITCEGGNCTTGVTFMTDSNGFYAFGNLVPGDYVISEQQVAGWTQTFPTTADQKYHLSLHSAEHIQDNNFGNEPPPPPPDDDYDWGDAPESVDPDLATVFPEGYPTTKANNGAFHPVNAEVRIGPFVDLELDGQPTIPADGDDETASDDEDGIKFWSDFVLLSRKLNPASDEETIVPGQIAGEDGKIVVYPSTNGKLDGWVDWNRDGDWDDAGEKVYDGEMVTAMSDTLVWSTPETADAGYTYARFRFTLDGVAAPDGAGSDGEVEDYILYTLVSEDLTAADDTEDVNPGDGICADASGFCTVRAAIMESNASGIPMLVNAGSLAKNGMAVLQPQSPYPVITGALLLNGAGTLEIDGSQAGAAAHGFVLQGNSSILAATTIHSFGGDGIRVEGNDNAAFENQIRDNGGAGINVVSGTGNTFRMNNVSGNGGIGIDLNDDGVTENDAGDGDAGPNGLQNTPLVGSVTAENGHIEGNISSTADTEFTIDLFVSPTCDASGYGEGTAFLGSALVTTNNLGSTGFNVFVADDAIQVGDAVTATATGPEGTSEFSSCFYAVTTDVEDAPEPEVPNDYELFQNYPNPFNPTTHIRFAISNREWVTLEVYNLLGKKVETLVDGWRDAGEFTVEFDAIDLPSGIYLYRITAGSFTRAKQLTLLK